MAVVSVKYQCGCKYSTEKPEEAVKHCDDRQHTLTVLGTIQPDNKK